MDSSSLSHTRWKCQYHIVFIPKYRRKALYGSVKEDIREILKTLCDYKKVEIIAGAVCVDHVHLSLSIVQHLPQGGNACGGAWSDTQATILNVAKNRRLRRSRNPRRAGR